MTTFAGGAVGSLLRTTALKLDSLARDRVRRRQRDRGHPDDP